MPHDIDVSEYWLLNVFDCDVPQSRNQDSLTSFGGGGIQNRPTSVNDSNSDIGRIVKDISPFA